RSAAAAPCNDAGSDQWTCQGLDATPEAFTPSSNNFLFDLGPDTSDPYLLHVTGASNAFFLGPATNTDGRIHLYTKSAIVTADQIGLLINQDSGVDVTIDIDDGSSVFGNDAGILANQIINASGGSIVVNNLGHIEGGNGLYAGLQIQGL